MPASVECAIALENAGSVPECCVTWYWIGVSFFWSSASDGFTKVAGFHAFGEAAGAAGVGAPGAAARKSENRIAIMVSPWA
jgi:hypothetical protein